MGNTEQIIVWFLFIAMLGAVMFLPQWRARRRRSKEIAELRPGDKVMTVGGIIGTLKLFDAEQGRARLEIAKGVEIEILAAAIGRKMDEA